MAFASRCAHRLLLLLNIIQREPASELQLAVMTIVRAAEQSASTATLLARTIASSVRVLKASNLMGDESEVAKTALAAAHGLACDAAQRTVISLQRLANVRTLRFALLPRRDFDNILRLAKEGNWTDDTPVPPDVFGPMWDREAPAWWRDYSDIIIPDLPGSSKTPE
jgi:hypothetical protein